MDETFFPRIIEARKAKKHEKCCEINLMDNKVITLKLQNLHRDFEILSMKDTESVKKFYSRVIN